MDLGNISRDIATNEAIAVIKDMSEPDRWRAVAMLKEMLIGHRKALKEAV